MDRRKQNYLITQLVKGVSLEKADTHSKEEREEELFNHIRQSEAETEEYINKRRMLG